MSRRHRRGRLGGFRRGGWPGSLGGGAGAGRPGRDRSARGRARLAEGGRPSATAEVRGPADDHHGTAARKPVARNIARVGLSLAIAFGVLAAGAGYWQVIRSTDLSSAPDDPAVIAAARNAPRGRILDRNGTVLASNKKDKNGEPYRVYKDTSMTPVLGYSSLIYGTAGLERTYNAELSGLKRADPVADALSKFQSTKYDPQDMKLTISLPLQKAALKALGSDRGAVVMIDPKTGEVLALASNPTFDASALANPATAAKTWAALNADKSQPLLPRATLGTYVPGSIMKIVTAIAGLSSGALTADTTFAQQPGAEKKGLLISGFRVTDAHNTYTGSKLLNLVDATEVSDNIWFALAGLATGGGAFDAAARRLGFEAPIPFDLPTAVSQLTNGGGRLPGGFLDDVELANAAYGQAETLVTPLQMALVAATRRQRRRADEAPPRRIVHRRQRYARHPAGTDRDRLLDRPGGGRDPGHGEGGRGPDRQVLHVRRRDPRRRYGRQDRHGPARRRGGAALVVHRLRPVSSPKVAIAVVVENGGHGSARAAPIAGQLMKLYLDTLGK